MCFTESYQKIENGYVVEKQTTCLLNHGQLWEDWTGLLTFRLWNVLGLPGDLLINNTFS